MASHWSTDPNEGTTGRKDDPPDAHAALRRAVTLLAEDPSLESFLGQMLRAIAAQFGAVGANLWRYDAATDRGSILLAMEDGEVVGKGAGLHPAFTRDIIDVSRESHALPVLERGRVKVDHEEDFAAEPKYAPFRKYLRERGVRTIASVPMFFGDAYIGSVALRFSDRRPFVLEEEQLALALVGQVTISLEMRRLGDEAKQAAVARERERAATRRAAALARANAAVRLSLDRLADSRDLDAFVGYVLGVFVAEFGALGGEYWRYRPADQVYEVALSLDDGRVVPGGDSPIGRAAAARQVDQLEERYREGESRTLKGQINTMDAEFIATHPSIAPFRPHLDGVRTIIGVPLFLRDEFLGAVCLRFAEDRRLGPEEEELAFALAQQVVLAIELTRLSKLAESAAVAREQEEAARCRAAELAKANAALRESVASLAHSLDLEPFLEHVLRAVDGQFGSPGMTLWLIDEARRFQHLHAVCFDGVVTRRVPDAGGFEFKHRFPMMPNTEMTLRGEPFFVPDLPDNPDLDAGTSGWLRHNGVSAILVLPLIVGDRAIGSLCVHKPDNVPFPQSQVEMGLALAQQAALAVHVTGLAEQAKQAAVAREQEQAAREKAAELAHANQIMRANLEVMTSMQSLDEFIGTVMVAINANLGAAGSTLWILDPGRKQGSLAMTVLDGRWYLQPPGSPGAMHKTEFPFDETTAEYLLQSQKPRFIADLQAHPHVDEGTRAWLVNRGVVGLQELPFCVGNNVFGVLDIHRPDNRPFPEQKLLLAVALAQQVGLAMHITRLAEEAKRAAVAVEQEKAARDRAAVLARANSALSVSLDRLAEQDDLDTFLGHVLRVFVEQFGAVGGEVWRFLPEKWWYEVAVSCEGTRVMSGGESPIGLAGRERYHTRSHEDDVVQASVRKGSILSMDAAYIATDPALELFRPHLEGIRTIISTPLFLREEHLGTVALRFAQDRAFTADERELAFALASQVVLAIELTRLAEQAKQAALAREQEKAARNQAAELTKANEAMRSTVEVMTSIPALDDLLGRVMQVIVERLASPGSTLWLLEAEGSNLHLACVGGQVSADPPEMDGHRLSRRISLHPDTDYRRQSVLDDRYYFLPDAAASPDLDEPTRGWMRATGAIGLLVIPMRVADRVIGCLCIHKPDGVPFPPEQTELAVALTQQASLALHVARLGDEAREAAVAAEQKKAELARASELLKANEILRTTSGVLTADSELEEVIGQVMSAMNDIVGHEVCTLWLWDREKMTTRLYMILNRGQQPVYADDSDHLCRGIDFPMSLDKYVENRLEVEKLPVIIDDIPACDSIRPEHQEFMKQVGAKQLIYVPLVAGDQVIGTFMFRSSERPPFRDDQLDLIQALACQATLAVKLMRLAAARRESAVLAERHLASQRQVAELARTNEVMRGTLAELISQHSLEDFLTSILRAINQSLDAPGSSLWLLDRAGETSKLHLMCLDGIVYRVPPTAEGHSFATQYSVSRSYGVVVSGTSHFIRNLPDLAEIDPGTSAWLRHHGVEGILNIPLIIGEIVIASLSIHKTDNVPFRPEAVELAIALGQQAALAIHVTRLAQEAQTQAEEAAVGRERTRMAREIHDTIAQGLVGILMHVRAARADVDDNRLAIAERLAAENLAEARRSVRALRPNGAGRKPWLDRLRGAMSGLAETAQRRVAVVVSGRASPMPHEVEDELLRIAREAVGNAIRHSGEDRVEVAVESIGAGVVMSVVDRGRGFDVGRVEDGRYGLLGMQERADRVGAVLTIISEPGRGTQVVVAWRPAEGKS